VLTPSRQSDAVLEPEQQYAVVLVNEDQLNQLMRRPGVRQVNRGYSVPDVHTRYLRLKRRTATAAVLLLILATGGFFYFVAPQPAMASMFPWKETAEAPTLITGASFSVTVASLESGDGVGTAASRVRTLGLPAFTRLSPDRRQLHQAMVGPYASLDEAERVQRRLGRSGFTGARIFVDESLRNAPRNELYAESSQGNPGVLLLGAPDRVSLVFEMPLEPRQVRSRRADNILDLDVGPMSNPIHPQQWSAPEGVHLVERVAIEGIAAGESGLFMRAHVAVPEFARANVRTEGRRVYVDLTWPLVAADASAPRSAFQAPAPARPEPKPAVAAAREDDQLGVNYGEALRPVLERVAAIKPFLISAAQSGSPDVLGALDETLATLEASLKALHAPAAALDQHQMLIASIRTARRAMDPAFGGDRPAQAREAFVLYDAATTTTSLKPSAQ
jgi:hypothetical protein